MLMFSKFFGAAILTINGLSLATEVLQGISSPKHKFRIVANYQPIRATEPANSNVTDLTPSYFTGDGSKRVKITYGPYTAPSSSLNNGMADFEGKDITMPCKDCLITYMVAGLEYPNGSYANADTGMWLHHTVLMDTAKNDTVCSLGIANRFFASGNERTIFDLTVNGYTEIFRLSYAFPANVRAGHRRRATMYHQTQHFV
jgi:hypothetical protein